MSTEKAFPDPGGCCVGANGGSLSALTLITTGKADARADSSYYGCFGRAVAHKEIFSELFYTEL